MTPTTIPDNDALALPLLRRAAQVGPGHKGARKPSDSAERAEIAAGIRDLGLEPPNHLDSERTWVDRRAKLFEAGDYPDKGVTVEPAHLAALQAGFDLPVPILIEHATSPLEIGFLTSVVADGPDLMGTVALTREASDLIDGSGAHALSLGLSPDLKTIREVSLVQRPRVASARIFGDGPTFVADLAAQGPGERRPKDTRATVDRFLNEGRLVPAQAPFATALLDLSQPVEFADGRAAVGLLVEKLISSALPHALFGEKAAVGAPIPATFTPDEAAFYRRTFPDISLEEIARRIGG